MSFEADEQPLGWRLPLAAPPEAVYRLPATDAGRARFWAESAAEQDGAIHFVFPNGAIWRGEILEAQPPRCSAVRCYGGSRAAFTLEEDGGGGTDLTLTDEGVPSADRAEVTAGWVSVLMALKAAGFEIDLRNHDPERSWDQGYADN
jgi:uncharacterized protein YndB with AHSA1/START domain